jgi:hypothetical protein
LKLLTDDLYLSAPQSVKRFFAEWLAGCSSEFRELWGRNMHRTGSFLSLLLLATVLLGSGTIAGCASRVRIYDQDHADWHRWDHNEDLAYRRYLSENHKDYRDFSKLSGDEQSQYWNWRHAHPDNR